MAQYRQSGFDRLTAGRGHDPVYVNGGIASSDHVSIGIRPSNKLSHRARRSVHKGGSGCCGGCCGGFARYVSFGTVVTVLCFVLALTAFVYVYISADKKGAEANNIGTIRYDDFKNDFLTNVSRINMSQVQFGHGSVSSGRDSRYWDRDDRRRDDDYEEEVMDESNEDKTVNSNHGQKGEGSIKKSTRSIVVQGTNSHSLYNEAGRDELKMYEEKYEESLKNFGDASTESEARNQESIDVNLGKDYNETDTDDDYDDAIDLHDVLMDEYEENRHGTADNEDFKHLSRSVEKDRNLIEHGEGASSQSSRDRSFESHSADNLTAISNGRSTSSASGKRPKRHRFSCPLKLLNSTAQIVEPLESRKFMRFSLQYTVTEEKPDAVDVWEPRFAGHQSLREREESFVARDQKINCGFVKGPTGYPSTGFDLAEDDSRYMNKCHIAVISCIFGNSDRLRSPTGKTVSSLSKKNVCFVMFVDERTLQTLFAEGQMPDEMGFIGLWKVVVVKNLPYKDMRRVGKIPKLLPHRLFPSARYSIWLDSKLRLQRDPLLILEYFLWRKGNEFAISNHYDRHCVWEEVAQNKRLNKYNHAAIDQQFAFYQADGLKRFNRSDPKRPLPSYVPEGSFIVRAHTPMSNLFSCLWFNEVDRFTPRDQLSFAHTYLKLRKKNPEKPLYLHMFKDCERRTIAKLYHHRTEEKQNIVQKSSE